MATHKVLARLHRLEGGRHPGTPLSTGSTLSTDPLFTNHFLSSIYDPDSDPDSALIPRMVSNRGFQVTEPTTRKSYKTGVKLGRKWASIDGQMMDAVFRPHGVNRMGLHEGCVDRQDRMSTEKLDIV